MFLCGREKRSTGCAAVSWRVLFGTVQGVSQGSPLSLDLL